MMHDGYLLYDSSAIIECAVRSRRVFVQKDSADDKECTAGTSLSVHPLNFCASSRTERAIVKNGLELGVLKPPGGASLPSE